MERPYTGLTAKVKIGNVTIGYISGVTLNLDRDIIGIDQFGAAYKEKVPGIKDWTASADGTFAVAPGGGQEKLFQSYDNGQLITLGIFLNDFVYFEGSALIKNLKVDAKTNEVTTLSCDFEGTGAITRTLPQFYQFNVSSGVGGTCTPAGIFNVAAAGSQAITITTSTGYVVSSLLDNSVEKKTDIVAGVYTLSAIAADHTIVITFVKS